MKIKIWKEVLDRVDFKVHFIYARRLVKLSSGLSLKCNIKPLLAPGKLKTKRVENKLRLIKLTKKSLEDELNIVKIDKEYSTASALWLPIKTYYLLYHLLSVIDYILTGKINSLNIEHGLYSSIFSERLREKKFQFSEKKFNDVFTAEEAFNFKSESGEILSHSVTDDTIYKLVMKKTANYKKENHQLRAKIDLRTKKGREKMNKYLSNKFSVSIFDFFYLMRIKSSYRGFNFIDDMPATETKKYFKEYYTLSENFYNCFDNLKNKLLVDVHFKQNY